jgi:hypothetical protein
VGLGDAERWEIRRERHRRRLGARHPRCTTCGESEPAALVGRVTEVRCYECLLIADGKNPIEAHHYAGRANDAFTVLLRGNAHRVVSDEIYTWPDRTRLNPAGSGLRAAAAALRGRLAVERQMVDRIDGPLIDYLERLDERLTELHGKRWWEPLGLEPPPVLR